MTSSSMRACEVAHAAQQLRAPPCAQSAARAAAGCRSQLPAPKSAYDADDVLAFLVAEEAFEVEGTRLPGQLLNLAAPFLLRGGGGSGGA